MAVAARASDLATLLRPSSVAIVGASEDPFTYSGASVANLLRTGYRGRIFPVNLKRETVQGLPAYPSVSEIPEPVDTAILAVSTGAVLPVLRECIEKVNADLSTDAMLAGSQVSRFLVLHKELDADDGELTRTNKVRRGFIADKYGVLVDALYAGRTEQYIETQVKFEDGRTGSVSATLKLSDTKTFTPVKAAA